VCYHSGVPPVTASSKVSLRAATGRKRRAPRRRNGGVAGLLREIREIYILARQEKLVALLSWLLLFILTASVVFVVAERGRNADVTNYFDALYWSLISFSTVGYGDLVPTTTIARASALVMVLSFLALMPLVGATITSIYVSKKIKGVSGLEQLNFSDHIVICGWNNKGDNILAGLQAMTEQSPVVIVGELEPDHVENLTQAYPQLDLHFVRGPYHSEPTLKRANVRRARVAVVLISYRMDSMLRSDEKAVLAVLTLRELGPEIRIVAECFANSYRGHLRRAGADQVVVSGELDGFMLTAAAVSPGLDSSVKDALSFGAGHDLWTAPIPAEFAGRTFRELARHWLDEKCWLLLGLVQEHRKLGIQDVLSGETSGIDSFIVRQFELAGRGQGGSQHLHFMNPGPDHIISEHDRAIVIFPAEESNA